jgi:hypothetical protein
LKEFEKERQSDREPEEDERASLLPRSKSRKRALVPPRRNWVLLQSLFRTFSPD